MFYGRFANILLMDNLNVELIWRAVKNTKSAISSDEKCIYNNYEAVVMTDNVESVQQYLHVKSSDDVSDQMTNETLEIAAKMFWYLNSCTKESKPWVQFYTNLFQNSPPDQIVLSLNRILKKDNKKFDAIAMTLFHNLTSLLNLRYPEIQSFVNGKKNSSLNTGKRVKSTSGA